MTDTSTLRDKIVALDRLSLNYGGLSKSPSGRYVRLAEVLAILDAQTEQPDIQLSGPKVEGDAPDQTGVSPAPDAVAEAGLNELLDPDMSGATLRLHMGEMTAFEAQAARAAIRWANTRLEHAIRALARQQGADTPAADRKSSI